MNKRILILGICCLTILFLTGCINTQDDWKTNYCKSEGWDGLTFNNFGYVCYKEMLDDSGLGTQFVISGDIDWKQIKGKV